MSVSQAFDPSRLLSRVMLGKPMGNPRMQLPGHHKLQLASRGVRLEVRVKSCCGAVLSCSHNAVALSYCVLILLCLILLCLILLSRCCCVLIPLSHCCCCCRQLLS